MVFINLKILEFERRFVFIQVENLPKMAHDLFVSKIKIILIITVLTVGAGVGYRLVSPLFLMKEVHEGVEEITKIAVPAGMGSRMEEPQAVRTGKFIGADDFHKADGTARVLKIGDRYFVRFEDDFKVTNGPDLFVYFGKDGKYAATARLGRLKGNVGSQNYEVPAEINPLDYNEVWVWCRAFSVPFGHTRF